MKKFLFLAAIIPAIFLFSGCGQEMDVTVYNATGITSANGSIAINGHTDKVDMWGTPSTYALSADDVNSTNSISFKAKESDTLSVSANGYICTAVDATGMCTAVQSFYVGPSEQVIYGSFMEDAHWYAAINMGSIVFFKK